MSTAVKRDLLQTALSNASLSTLCKAVETAELADALKGEGPLTIFAPTDEAFRQIPKAALDSVMKDQPRLQSILKYHVVPGKHMSSEVTRMQSIETLQGQTLEVSTEDGCRINDACVQQADIECSNGVIHIIDTVLMPR